MKKSNLVLCFTILLILTLITGCKEPKTYLVRLMDGETIAREGTVHLDGQPIATVTDIITYEQETVAKIKLVDDKYAELLLIGTVRTPQKNTIYLTARTAKPDAKPLLNESVINVQNEIEFIAHKYATRWNIIALLAISVVSIILVFLLKSVVRFFVLIVCLVLAAGTAYFLYPLGIPYVEKLYNYMPDDVFNKTSIQTIDEQKSTDISENDIGKNLKVIIRSAPNPKYISFAILAIISFILYSILFKAAMPAESS